MADIVVDVETAGPPVWSEIDLTTRMYLIEREANRLRKDGVRGEDIDGDAIIERTFERLALELGLAQIVAIGLWLVDDRRGMVLLNGTGEPIPGASKTVYSDETGVLDSFWSTLSQFRKVRVVTFNGRTFDGPLLMIRSAQKGVPCVRNLVPYRYDLSEHCDLADVLNFQGALWGGYSLDYWCRRFGIESPKDAGISGKDVGTLFSAGKIETIGEYVLRDIQAEAELYRKLRDASLLAQFKGGPQPVAAYV